MEKEFKVGIDCNNYKVEKFKLELVLRGFVNFKLFPSKERETTVIIITTEPSQLPEIHRICRDVEAHFLAQKN